MNWGLFVERPLSMIVRRLSDTRARLASKGLQTTQNNKTQQNNRNHIKRNKHKNHRMTEETEHVVHITTQTKQTKTQPVDSVGAASCRCAMSVVVQAEKFEFLLLECGHKRLLKNPSGQSLVALLYLPRAENELIKRNELFERTAVLLRTT